MLAPLQDPVALGSIVARGSAERYINLLEQQREVALAGVDAEPFVKDVKVDDAEVKAFYDGQRQGVRDARAGALRVRAAHAGRAGSARWPSIPPR